MEQLEEKLTVSPNLFMVGAIHQRTVEFNFMTILIKATSWHVWFVCLKHSLSSDEKENVKKIFFILF